MKKRISNDVQDDQNYDSFLDIVANLVGILVILIMVIGVRARDAWKAVSPPSRGNTPPVTLVESKPAAKPKLDLAAKQQHVAMLTERAEAARAEATRVKFDIHEMDQNIGEIAEQAAAEQRRRNELQLLISLSEKALEERRGKLEAGAQIQLAMAKQIDEALLELESLEGNLHALLSEQPSPQVLPHRATPMARMVLGQEEHFRLLGGRLSHVPITEMTAMLKRDAGNKLWKLKKADEITETIGPINGYRMKYTLERREHRIATPEGPRLQKVVELQRFVMVPESSTLGQTVAAAILPDSALRRQLSGYSPAETTITIWTYPDSFADFRELKTFLSELGFIVAARPLPAGFPIGGSPDGTKSAAE